MNTRDTLNTMLAAPVPIDARVAAAANGGLVPPPLCYVCGEVVKDVPEREQLTSRRQMNVPVLCCSPGHERYRNGAVRHHYCAPGTARWAQHQDRSDPRAMAWVRRFQIDPSDTGELEGRPMAAKKSKKAKAKKENGQKKERARAAVLPPAGTILRKKYKGKDIEVRVNTNTFTYDGEQYESFAKVVQKITKWEFLPNPYRFFKKALEEAAERTSAS